MQTSKAEVIIKQGSCQRNTGQACHEGWRPFSCAISVLGPHMLPGLSYLLTHLYKHMHTSHRTHTLICPAPPTPFVEYRYIYTYKCTLMHLHTPISQNTHSCTHTHPLKLTHPLAGSRQSKSLGAKYVLLPVHRRSGEWLQHSPLIPSTWEALGAAALNTSFHFDFFLNGNFKHTPK